MNNPCNSKLTHLRVPRSICAPWIMLSLLLALPAAVQAQFNYTTNNGSITITGYTGPGGAVTIPDTINALPVTAIGGHLNTSGVWEGAFYQCTNLTSVTIPDSVTYIGNAAFQFCGLTSVTIGDNVTNIGEAAFANCDSLTSVTIPDSVTYMGRAAFEYLRPNQRHDRPQPYQHRGRSVRRVPQPGQCHHPRYHHQHRCAGVR